MFDNLKIQSHKGLYGVNFVGSIFDVCDQLNQNKYHFIVDENIVRLYGNKFTNILKQGRAIVIEANEGNKSLDAISSVVSKLVENKVRRGDVLVAIGGGVIQDITCFLASTLLRGIDWKFVPTTLLSQADSCIGSKSSINVGGVKNILGTFNPPSEIYISQDFLKTLSPEELNSGIGEIIKVHAIDGKDSFDRLAKDYLSIFNSENVLLSYIKASLLIKKRFIEQDEFDKGIRQIFNYGHSFGHAIEAASQYKISHGIAVTMGMEIANHISMQRGSLPESEYYRMHGLIHQNYKNFINPTVLIDGLYSNLLKDKKNTDKKLVVVLPIGDEAQIQCVEVSQGNEFYMQCSRALNEVMG